MATTWTHNGWRRETGTAAQRTKLILHIEEVEQRFASFRAQGTDAQNAQRFELDAYLARLEKKLTELEKALSLDVGADDPVFIEARPIVGKF